MGEGDMDFRGHLEVGGSEERPEAETHVGPMRDLGGNKYFSGVTAVGQEMEGE